MFREKRSDQFVILISICVLPVFSALYLRFKYCLFSGRFYLGLALLQHIQRELGAKHLLNKHYLTIKGLFQIFIFGKSLPDLFNVVLTF